MTSKLRASDAFIAALFVVTQVELWWFHDQTSPSEAENGTTAAVSAGLLIAAVLAASTAAGTADRRRAYVGLVATLLYVGEFATFAPIAVIDAGDRRWWVFAAAVVATAVAWSLGGLIARRAAARAAAVAAAVAAAAAERSAQARAAEAADRLAEARERYAAVEAGFQAVIVEVVASQQALVRNAYPDDILSRMRAAEDAIYAAVAGLERFMVPAGADPAGRAPQAETVGGSPDQAQASGSDRAQADCPSDLPAELTRR